MGVSREELSEQVERARAGDRLAFGRVIDLSKGMIYWRLLKLGVQESDCDDLVEDAFYRIWRKLHLLRDAERFWPWSWAIALTVYLRWRAARESEERTLAFVPPESLRDRLAPPARGQLSAAEASAFFEGLPAEHALLLRRRFVDRLRLSEIGRLMGLTVDQVRRRLEHARQSFATRHAAWSRE